MQEPNAFNRPPRQQFLALSIEPLDIPAPPNEQAPPSQNLWIGVLPVMGIGVMALFYLWRAATVEGSSALFAIPLFVLAVFAIGGTLAANRARTREHFQREQARQLAYLRTLERKRARLQAAHDAQRGILLHRFPHAAHGLDMALSRDPSLWERRPEDDDFLAVRVGMGRVQSPVPVLPPDPDAPSATLARAQQLIDAYRYLEDVPLLLSLHEHSAVGICGRRDLMLAAVRAMLCHLALSHAPADLQILLIAPAAPEADWRWLRWLPHARDERRDALASDPLTMRALLGELSQTLDTRAKHSGTHLPHLLIVFDNPALAENETVYTSILRDGAALGVSALCLAPTYETVPGACNAVIDLLNNGAFRLIATQYDDPQRGDAVDTLPTADAEHIARGLASISVREVGAAGRIPRSVGFLDLYGVARAQDLLGVAAARWSRPLGEDTLPFAVPIGRESLTTNMLLRLDEDHHGPHGVLAGTTGSGKSELLQTLVCALAVEHDPRWVNFLLIDFKGGSTFGVFADLPHTVGMVTNLDGVLVERALAALRAETKYRQQFLKQMNVRDIAQYLRHHAATPEQINAPNFQPLPHLFVIVDEFAQLAKEMPAFMQELVRTAQVGRSLGLHLILGTQSPMEVITDEMNDNLQFRICLRVQNAEASRAVLRRPDAAYLPSGLAGRGYFMVGERSVYKQFQTAYAGSDYTEDASAEPLSLELLLPNGATLNLLESQSPPTSALSGRTLPEDTPYTTAAAVVDVLRQHTRTQDIPLMPPILLPPLEEQLSLEQPFLHMDARGWDGQGWRSAGKDEHGLPIRLGSAPIGMVDDVHTRRQFPLWVHLNDDGQAWGRGGHLLVIGGPSSGKTTLLNTLALSEALLHPPNTLHIYLLSFNGGGLNPLSPLPHAERVVHGTENERVRRLFGRLINTLHERQTSRRNAKAQPLILLILDGYEGLRDTYYEAHMADFERLIAEGRNAGIFVAFSANSISAIPDRLRSLVPQRVALQLGSTGDYALAVGQVNLTDAGRNLARGRGYVAASPPLMCQICLPTFGNAFNTENITQQLRKLVNEMRQRAALGGQMQAPAPITELAAVIPLESLPPAPPFQEMRVLLGQLDDDALSPFMLDWDEQGPHFIVTGSPASGKTNLLMAAALIAAQHLSPQHLRFLLLDLGGRSLRQLEPLKHVLARVTNSLELETQLKALSREVQALEGTADAKPPRTVILIDDYEIAADVMSMNLDALRQLRDHARLHAPLGIHIWAAGYLERIGDPLIKQLLLRRSGFALRERDALHQLNVRVPNLPSEPMPVGRAYFAQQNRVQVVQTPLIDDVPALVRQLNERIWQQADPAMWRYPYAHGLQGGSTSAQAQLNEGHNTLDIDTDGLIDDLLGNGDTP